MSTWFGWIKHLDRDRSWNFVSLNFEFLLFLNHGDVTWDSPKGKSFGEKEGIFRHIVLGRVRGVISTL
jgi:hypothetical protein